MEIPAFSGNKSRVVIKNVLDHKVYYIYFPSLDIYCGIAIYKDSKQILTIELLTDGSITYSNRQFIHSPIMTEAIIHSFINTDLYIINYIDQHSNSRMLCVECRENYEIKWYLVYLSLYRNSCGRKNYIVCNADKVKNQHLSKYLDKIAQEGIDKLDAYSKSLLQILYDHCYTHIPGVNRLIRDYVVYNAIKK